MDTSAQDLPCRLKSAAMESTIVVLPPPCGQLIPTNSGGAFAPSELAAAEAERCASSKPSIQ